MTAQSLFRPSIWLTFASSCRPESRKDNPVHMYNKQSTQTEIQKRSHNSKTEQPSEEAYITRNTRPQPLRSDISNTKDPCQGGYDPFGAFGFLFDSQVNQLLVFHKEAYLASPLTPKIRTSMYGLDRHAWGLMVCALQDLCATPAFISAAALICGRFTESSALTKLSDEPRCCTILVLWEIVAVEAIGWQLATCMRAFTTAELAARNSHAVAIHSRYLASLPSEVSPKELGILVYGLRFNVRRQQCPELSSTSTTISSGQALDRRG